MKPNRPKILAGIHPRDFVFDKYYSLVPALGPYLTSHLHPEPCKPQALNAKQQTLQARNVEVARALVARGNAEVPTLPHGSAGSTPVSVFRNNAAD